MYLLDSGNSRIRVAGGAGATSWSVWHQDASWVDPDGLDVGPDGAVDVPDTENHRVSVLRADGAFLGHLAQAPPVASPQKAEVDAAGRIFVLDSDSARLLAFLGATAPPPYEPYILVRDQPDVDLATAPATGLELYSFQQPAALRSNNAVVAALRW